MKNRIRLFVVVLAMLMVVFPAFAGWHASGRLTNPTTNQVILDTGALPGPAGRSFVVVGSATVASVFEVQWRNATDTATIKSQILSVPANGTAVLPESNSTFVMDDQERVRIIMVAGVTGSVSASMFIQD